MTGALFASRLEVVGNIRSLARLICRSGGDERLGADNVQERNLIVAVWNIFRRVGDWSSHKKKSSGEKRQFGMFYVQIIAIASVDAEWDKRRPFQ